MGVGAGGHPAVVAPGCLSGLGPGHGMELRTGERGPDLGGTGHASRCRKRGKRRPLPGAHFLASSKLCLSGYAQEPTLMCQPHEPPQPHRCSVGQKHREEAPPSK